MVRDVTPLTPPPIVEPKLHTQRRSSAMSLKTAHKKEEDALINQQIQVALPRNAFSESEFFVFWHKYIDILNVQGEKMLASILNSSDPVVEGNLVKLTYANAMMMEEVKKHSSAILNYLRDNLQNFDLQFDLHYNEAEEKNYVYTAEEKYDKLQEINPMLEAFRKQFFLDI